MSNPQPQKSGAAKRKEKQERDKKEGRGAQTLYNVGFVKTPAPASATAASTAAAEDSSPTVSDSSGPAESATNLVHESETEKMSSGESGVTVTDHAGDVGSLKNTTPSQAEITQFVQCGPPKHPALFPLDVHNRNFPTSLLHCTLPNKEVVKRDWLVWSESRHALFCFPCRLYSTQPASTRSSFASTSGYSTEMKWQKLYIRIPEHQTSNGHKECYLTLRCYEKFLGRGCAIFQNIEKHIDSEREVWRQILRRMLDVTFFLGERGLAFRGDSQRIGDSNNGNFLGILELLSRYDPILEKHLHRVQEAQQSGHRLQVHYLSGDTQNEFIAVCAKQIRSVILQQREEAKYYSVIVDATPDAAHVEQTTFIVRYMHHDAEVNKYEVQERFLEFVDCHQKTGSAIVDLITSTLEQKHSIPISDCRGQGYDNGSNMSGAYSGAQAHLLAVNPLAKFSPCACHSLNLCGVHAAECCPEVITYFGIVQQLYNLFSSSPQRWLILKEAIGCSLHSTSATRWSARVDSVRPIIKHLHQLTAALALLGDLNLTPETRAVVRGVVHYVKTFECLMLGSIWLKVLVAIDNRNRVLQARNMTIDVAVRNLESLLEELANLRENWDAILSEVTAVAIEMGVDPKFTEVRVRKRKRFHDEIDDAMPGASSESEQVRAADDASNLFKCNIFYALMDAVMMNLTTRFQALKSLNATFGFLWNYVNLTNEQLMVDCTAFVNEYKEDVTSDLCDEVKHLKSIHSANLVQQDTADSNHSTRALQPLDLLNKLCELNLKSLFPNCCVALRIFCTLPVTVAEGERSFSNLARIKNCLRSTMCQDRLTDLGTLAIESEFGRKMNFSSIIDSFADKKARKAMLQ